MQSKLLAQITNPVLPSQLGNNPAGGGAVVGLVIGNIIGMIVIIAFFLAMLFLIMGGVSWVTSGGDKGQLEAARNKIIHALLGLIIIASVWAIMNIVGPFLGLTFPNLTFPTIQ